LALVAVALLVAGLPGTPESLAAHPPPLITQRGVVASDEATASSVGASVLARGGNAVDAAAATALALGVVNPTSSGIGGGGFAVVWSAAERKVRVYDFRETAPAALRPESFQVGGKIDAQKSRTGGLAVGVPGEIAGLHDMVAHQGRWTWKRVVTPAAQLARDGFDVGWFLATIAGREVPKLPAGAPYDRLRALLTQGGAPLMRGARLQRRALAATLTAIAERGPDAFYKGANAGDIVATAAAAGGVLTTADLAAYKVVEREPLWGEWRGHRLATMPLPSSGGIILLEMLGILDRTGIDLKALGAGSSAALHVVAEILKHGFADRARLLGDDADASAAVSGMLAPERLAALARRVSVDRVQPHDQYGGAGVAATGGSDGGTSHVCVIDGDGNAVALTTTVNGYYGAKLVTAGGVVLNNEMDDFAMAPDAVNAFKLRQGARNLVAPGKRPLSSMTPTLIFDGDRVVACVGGSGGPMIISNVFQTVLNLFVFDMDAQAAVTAPRIHHQWEPDVLGVEADTPADVIDGLARRGQTVKPSSFITAVQVIRVRADGTREAASDPRKGGAPAVQPPAARRAPAAPRAAGAP